MKIYLFGVLSALACYASYMQGFSLGEARTVDRVNRVLTYQINSDEPETFDAVYYELNGLP